MTNGITIQCAECLEPIGETVWVLKFNEPAFSEGREVYVCSSVCVEKIKAKLTPTIETRTGGKND